MISTEAPLTLPLKDRVAGEIRAFMARHNITQSSLAPLLGWSQQYLSRRLTGAVPFDVADLDQLSRAFDVPVEDFFREANQHIFAKGARNIIYSFGLPIAA